MLCGQIPQGIFDPPSHRVSVDERIDQVVIRAMQQEPDRRYANTAEMKGDVEYIRQTPLPASGPGSPAPASGRKIPPRPSLAKAAADAAAEAAVEKTPEAKREKSLTPWLAGVAALCALVAVSVVVIQMMRPASSPTAANIAPPAPELAPIKPAVSAPDSSGEKPEAKVEKNEAAMAKPEPAATPSAAVAKTEPAPPVSPDASTAPVVPIASTPAKTEPASEPPAPVAPPPSEPPVAVATIPGTSRVVQVVPPPVATTSLVPAPAPVPRAQAVGPAPTGPATSAPDAAATDADWHTLASNGDILMARRQNDEAMDAYTTAFALATDGRPVSASEVTQLCRKLANYQAHFGSTADARQTLDQGRQTLKRMTAGKDIGDRQKYLEQIEYAIRSLPRD
jgi:hypothetical protein